MITNTAMADDNRAVERWENEGGKVQPSPFQVCYTPGNTNQFNKWR